MAINPKSIDEYIHSFPDSIQIKLEEIRKVIKETVPEAEERIGYDMPGFYYNGFLVYFAAFKNHIGLFPTSSGINKFKDEFSIYKYSKGTVQFPLYEPLPLELIKKIVKFRYEENRNKRKK